jgi:hypothetical protein
MTAINPNLVAIVLALTNFLSLGTFLYYLKKVAGKDKAVIFSKDALPLN